MTCGDGSRRDLRALELSRSPTFRVCDSRLSLCQGINVLEVRRCQPPVLVKTGHRVLLPVRQALGPFKYFLKDRHDLSLPWRLNLTKDPETSSSKVAAPYHLASASIRYRRRTRNCRRDGCLYAMC